MKIFGFEFNWPETKKAKIKRRLKEEGKIKTIKFVQHILNCNRFDADAYLIKLIEEGCIDRDLVRLYLMYKKWGVISKLKSVYRFNPGQIKMYVDNIIDFCEKENKKN